MAAGNPGGSLYKVNCAINTAGGARKSGLASTLGRDHWSTSAIQMHGQVMAKDRNMIFCINQLGGVGAGKSQFRVANSFASPDGYKRCKPYAFKKNML